MENRVREAIKLRAVSSWGEGVDIGGERGGGGGVKGAGGGGGGRGWRGFTLRGRRVA